MAHTVARRKWHYVPDGGLSVFFRLDDAAFHAYSAYARGTQGLTDAYSLLDLTPYGRQELVRREVIMARLIYTAILSLDGYVADADGSFSWAAPDDEVHRFVNDL